MAELVEGLTRAFPRRHHLLFADFDSLPPPTPKDGGEEEAEAAQRQGENVDGSEMAWLQTRRFTKQQHLYVKQTCTPSTPPSSRAATPKRGSMWTTPATW